MIATRRRWCFLILGLRGIWSSWKLKLGHWICDFIGCGTRIRHQCENCRGHQRWHTLHFTSGEKRRWGPVLQRRTGWWKNWFLCTRTAAASSVEVQIHYNIPSLALWEIQRSMRDQIRGRLVTLSDICWSCDMTKTCKTCNTIKGNKDGKLLLSIAMRKTFLKVTYLTSLDIQQWKKQKKSQYWRHMKLI